MIFSIQLNVIPNGLPWLRNNILTCSVVNVKHKLDCYSYRLTATHNCMCAALYGGSVLASCGVCRSVVVCSGVWWRAVVCSGVWWWMEICIGVQCRALVCTVVCSGVQWLWLCVSGV